MAHAERFDLQKDAKPQRDARQNHRRCQLVVCRIDELRPHPSYVRHHLTVGASKLSTLASRGDLAFQEPLVITQDRTLVDGYARLELARLQGRQTLSCIEYELTDEEALQWLLQRHFRSNGLNPYSRILIALDLESWFKEKARSNQRAGGQNKGSSKLTEDERMDVRSEIADAAGVSAGSVSKVKQLTRTAHRELSQALRSGEISIHRGWLLSKRSPEAQKEGLRLYRVTRLIRHTNRRLISRHRNEPAALTDLGLLIGRLSILENSDADPIRVVVLKGRHLGRTIAVSEQLLQWDLDDGGKENHALPTAP